MTTPTSTSQSAPLTPDTRSIAPQAPATPLTTTAGAAQTGTTSVLDTSVLLSDPKAVLRFAEHDVVLPVVVITELESKRDDPQLGHSLFAHVTLTRSERSPIAALVTDLLEGPEELGGVTSWRWWINTS